MNDEEVILAKEEIKEVSAPVAKPSAKVQAVAVIVPHEGSVEEKIASLVGAIAFLASKLPNGYEEIKVMFPHLNLQ